MVRPDRICRCSSNLATQTHHLAVAPENKWRVAHRGHRHNVAQDLASDFYQAERGAFGNGCWKTGGGINRCTGAGRIKPKPEHGAVALQCKVTSVTGPSDCRDIAQTGHDVLVVFVAAPPCHGAVPSNRP